MGTKIVRGRPEHAASLTDIAHAAKRFWGYPEHYIVQWRDELTVTPTQIRQLQFFVAFVDDRAAGFYALSDRGERMELAHMWIDPRQIGSGLGSALFRHAVEQAKLHGADALDISSDPNAEGFYEKMGARKVGRIPAPVAGKERYLPRLTLELSPAVPPRP